jgi:hypothetical protein
LTKASLNHIPKEIIFAYTLYKNGETIRSPYNMMPVNMNDYINDLTGTGVSLYGDGLVIINQNSKIINPLILVIIHLDSK